MKWKKVNLRAKEKNLPEIGMSVLWAIESKNVVGGRYSKFIGKLTDDTYIDTGLNRYKLTSKYWWCEMTDPVE